MSRHQTCIDPLTLNMSACSHTRLFAEWRHCWDGSQEVKMEVPARLMVSCLFVAGTVRSEIIKPWREWLCNYCAMGEWQWLRSDPPPYLLLLQELPRPRSVGLLYSVCSTDCCSSSSSSPSTPQLKEPESNAALTALGSILFYLISAWNTVIGQNIFFYNISNHSILWLRRIV